MGPHRWHPETAARPRGTPTIATAEQIRANRLSAQKSTGPKNTDATRYNGLTHGLCATPLVVPGESLESVRGGACRSWHGD